jgi:antitoxin component YwqK of YwqJK toxin-antitoxin module
MNGLWRYFHPNGELDYEANYEKGVLNGFYSSYYQNHKIKSEGGL